MKRHLNIPMAFLILTGALTVGAQAQSSSAQKVIATVPFEFNVGERRLPAGKYTITITNPNSDRKILQIRSMNGRSTAMIITTSGVRESAAGDAKLVFHRYGERYFFAQAQMAGDSTSLAVVKSKAERAEQQIIAGSRKKMVVMIAANN
jgi:hypothetical protein